MKHTALIFLLPFLVSCSPFNSPGSAERAGLRDELPPRKIKSLCDDILSSGEELTVYASPKGPEALEFLSYIIPILHERGELSMRLWFLENSSDQEIKSFLEGNEEGPDATELLRRANPILCGFETYRIFLEKLQTFYRDLEDPESLVVTSSDDVIFDFRLYDGHFRPKGDRLVYLIHSPLPEGRRWELPFGGLLYAMMIHEWSLREYAALSITDSSLGSSYLTDRDARENRRASDSLDGIFLMSFPRTYVPMKRIEGFVNEENISRVLDFFPRQLIREKTKPASYLVNSKIESRHNRAVRRLDRAYEAIKEEIPGYTSP